MGVYLDAAPIIDSVIHVMLSEDVMADEILDSTDIILQLPGER